MTFRDSNDPITCIGTYIKLNITIIHSTFTVIYHKIDCLLEILCYVSLGSLKPFVPNSSMGIALVIACTGLCKDLILIHMLNL